MIEINGVELELDLMDADVADSFQDAINELSIKSEETDRLGDAIRQQCVIVNDFFDKVFGDGASEAVFQGKMNLKNSLAAFEKVINEIPNAQESIHELTSKYTKKTAKPMDHLPKTKPVTNKKFVLAK
ncbi:MAG: hypothetical protein Q7J65_09245 [Candidatus Marinimicrobia bacterium]|nr:hypothetical protein [Candidatus Neomarinimicrobiota bacterium]